MYLECPSWHPGLLHKGPDWHSGRERERAAGGRLLWWVVAPWCCPARVGGGGGSPESPEPRLWKGCAGAHLAGSLTRVSLPSRRPWTLPVPALPLAFRAAASCLLPAPCGPRGARPSRHGGRPVGTSAPLQTRWAPGSQKARSVQPLDRALHAPSSRDRMALRWGHSEGAGACLIHSIRQQTAISIRLHHPCREFSSLLPA